MSHPHAVSAAFDPPIRPPPRAAWRNRGYWDIGPKSRGKLYRYSDEDYWLDVFYDTEKSRLYYTEMFP